jgi:hypothetical protein
MGAAYRVSGAPLATLLSGQTGPKAVDARPDGPYGLTPMMTTFKTTTKTNKPPRASGVVRA